MKIAIACDHGGFKLKQAVIQELKRLGHEVEDFGTYNEESCDYPDYASKAAKAVASGECEKGVVICGTGIGVSITANKVKVFVVHYATTFTVLRKQDNITMPTCLLWGQEL